MTDPIGGPCRDALHEDGEQVRSRFDNWLAQHRPTQAFASHGSPKVLGRALCVGRPIDEPGGSAASRRAAARRGDVAGDGTPSSGPWACPFAVVWVRSREPVRGDNFPDTGGGHPNLSGNASRRSPTSTDAFPDCPRSISASTPSYPGTLHASLSAQPNPSRYQKAHAQPRAKHSPHALAACQVAPEASPDTPERRSNPAGGIAGMHKMPDRSQPKHSRIPQSANEAGGEPSRNAQDAPGSQPRHSRVPHSAGRPSRQPIPDPQI